ncbi:5-formyltetrahydrofolate cyclo-ligase [Nocardioides panacisoli]|uniref:5-formyltetrahydrofolate cyclo-ligase n=1 Tax=Nocardioides panacisoli TaxID=627624 RepID=UPI001C628A97|nr:5-formyltetrahydrofolate cyclo-ligase [Nocardioides panacisoli]QYJ02821.1 5-formyltetrahydrofolate cyclo-ligase [Nocardioides panacisoli]
MAPSHRPEPSAAKTALRDQLLTARNRLSPAGIGAASRAIADHLLASAEVRRAATIGCYVSVGTEPGTSLLLDDLRTAGKRVLLPVLQRDNDLDWALYAGPASLASARLGLLEPVTRPLGPDAIGTADVVLLPGLAASPAGMRLGRGGGSYDRALARLHPGTWTCVLLHEGETGHDVPAEPHDRPVDAAATPSGVVRFRHG